MQREPKIFSLTSSEWLRAIAALRDLPDEAETCHAHQRVADAIGVRTYILDHCVTEHALRASRTRQASQPDVVHGSQSAREGSITHRPKRASAGVATKASDDPVVSARRGGRSA